MFMADQAKITSIDALESFRASLIVFLNKAHRSVDDASDAVRRMRIWLQHDQMIHWKGEIHRREKKLDQAKQELMSARISGDHDTAVLVRQQAVKKAKMAVSEAEEKLRNVKMWSQNFDSTVTPAVKKLESLREFLDNDLPKATAYLANTQKILEEYAGISGAPIEEPKPEVPLPNEPKNG